MDISFEEWKKKKDNRVVDTGAGITLYSDGPIAARGDDAASFKDRIISSKPSTFEEWSKRKSFTSDEPIPNSVKMIEGRSPNDNAIKPAIPYKEMTIPQRRAYDKQKMEYLYGPEQALLLNLAYENPPPVTNPRSKQLAAQMTHPIPEEQKPAGTWNPLVHTGKIMTDLSEGLGQVTGATSPERQRRVQNDINTYESYDQPLLAQIAGEALFGATPIGASPTVVSAATKGLAGLVGKAGAKGLSEKLAKDTLAKNLLMSQQRTMLPGFAGAAGGAGYAGAMFVDPEDPNPTATRLKRAAIAAPIGGAMDAVGVIAQNRMGIRQANKERARQSGDLPVTVRQPGGRLWEQNMPTYDAVRTRRSQGTGEYTRGILESAEKNAADDIAENAALIRAQATGSSAPEYKGEPLVGIISQLQKMKTREDELVTEFYDNFAKKNLQVHTFNNYGNDIIDAFDTYVKTNKPDMKKKPMRDMEDMMMELDTLGTDPTGTIPLSKLLDYQKKLGNIVEDSSGTANKMAAYMRSTINKKIDEATDAGELFGNQDHIDHFTQSLKVGKEHRAKYDNPILKKIAQDKLSPQEASNELFGKVEFDYTKKQGDAIQKLLDMNPDFKNPLKRELYQQTYSGFDKGKDFDIKDFVAQMDKGLDAGRAKPIFDKLLTPKEIRQLDSLHQISKKHIAPDDNPDWYMNTGPKMQALTYDLSNLTSTIPNKILNAATGLDDYLNALRYQSGKRGRTSSTRGVPKAAGIMGYEMENRDIDPIEALVNFYGPTFKEMFGN